MTVDRRITLAILRRLARTPLGEHLILGGSSGVHAFSDTIPALTEDVDLLADAEWVAEHEREILAEMEKAGFEHHEGTPTLTDETGQSVDLVGYSLMDRTDRIGGGESLRVMVFADLSTILSQPDAAVAVPEGGLALSAAALTVVKLMTIRLEKGMKDKLQALLIADEMSTDEDYRRALRRFLDAFEPDRVADAVADAQAAFLSISTDPELVQAEIRGYREMRSAVGRGLAVLEEITAIGGAG